MAGAYSICCMVEEMGLLIYMWMFKLEVQSKLFIQDLTILTGGEEYFHKVKYLKPRQVFKVGRHNV